MAFGAGGSTNNPQAGWATSANSGIMTGGSSITATTSDSALHALQYVFNTTTSLMNVDNTVTTGDTGNANIGNCVNCKIFFGQGFSGVDLIGYEVEMGIAPAALSTAVQTTLYHNQCSYWATGGSC
jgi:hypothetical protein